jgi:hypothetical protein
MIRNMAAAMMAFLAATNCWAADAQQTFDSLFGADAAKVAATPDGKDDVQLAQALLEKCESLKDDADLVNLILEKVADLASKDASGLALAEEALSRLADRLPAKRAELQERLLLVWRMQYQRSSGPPRAAAADKLAVRLMAMGDAFMVKSQPVEAEKLYLQASEIAASVSLPRTQDIAVKLREARALRDLAKRVEVLVEKLKTSPNDADAARQVVMGYAISLDNPAAAKPYLSDALPEPLRTAVPLAAEPLDKLAEQHLVTLFEFYSALLKGGLVDKAPLAGNDRTVALKRLKTYLERYFRVHTKRDAERLKADMIWKGAREELAKAGLIERWPFDKTELSLTPTPQQIAAHKSAIKYLWSRQTEDGSWANRSYSTPDPALDMASTASALWALMDAGAGAEEPRLAKGLERLCSMQSERTVSIAMRCCALQAADRIWPGKYRATILADTKLLLASANEKNGTFYRNCTGKPARSSYAADTVYGVMGLAAAARAGATVPKQYWQVLMKHVADTQTGDGGWSSGTFTYDSTAGSAIEGAIVLGIAASQSGQTADATLQMPAMRRGLDAVDRLLADMSKSTTTYYSDLPFTSFAMSRLGMIRCTERFGEANWYDACGKLLVATRARYSYSAPGGVITPEYTGHLGDTVATAQALMFYTMAPMPAD